MGHELVISTIDDVLRYVYTVEISKALDPLDSKDFLVINRRLRNAIHNVTAASEAEALRKALDRLDVDWPKLTVAQRERVLVAAKSAIRTTTIRYADLEKVFNKQGLMIVKGTREALAKTGLRLQTGLGKVDPKVLKANSKFQGNYVRDELGKRSEAFSTKARGVVDRGIREGKGREALTKDLQGEMTAWGIKRSDNYWRAIASTFDGNARSYAQLASFNEVGITAYRVEAILDKATTPYCRFLHGREFSVPIGLTHFQQASELADPTDVRYVKPWLRAGKDPEGQSVIYYKQRDGSRAQVARIEGPVSSPRFSSSISNEALAAAGITSPPYHANCRTTILPVF